MSRWLRPEGRYQRIRNVRRLTTPAGSQRCDPFRVVS
jgi:hypothetical protein